MIRPLAPVTTTLELLCTGPQGPFIITVELPDWEIGRQYPDICSVQTALFAFICSPPLYLLITSSLYRLLSPLLP